MLRSTLVNVAELPALSVTTTWPLTAAPSALSTRGLAMLVDARPDIASLRVNGMLTLVLFQPYEFGVGVGLPNVSTGGVASRFTVTDAFAVPPPEVTLQPSTTPTVSASTTRVSQPVFATMLAGDSSMFQLTCTSLRYQPLLPAMPTTTGCTLGALRSMLMGGVANVAWLPATSVTTTEPLRLAPSPPMTTGLGALVAATPDNASLAANAKLTSPLNQP